MGFLFEKKTKDFVKVLAIENDPPCLIKKLNKLNTYPKFSHIFGPIRLGIQILRKGQPHSSLLLPIELLIRKLRIWSNLAAVS